MKNKSVFSVRMKSMIGELKGFLASSTFARSKWNVKLAVQAFTCTSALTIAASPVLVHADEKQNASFQADSLIVVYREDTTMEERKSARELVKAQIAHLRDSELDRRYQHLLNGRIANYKLDQGSVLEAIEQLKGHSAVLYAEPDYILTANAIPNDTDFAGLWGLHNTGQTGGVDDADIDAVEAWDISTGSKDIIVGVIDSGIDYNHPDLKDNMWTNPGEIAGDGIDNDGNGYIDDVYGINTITDAGDPFDDDSHGTHVAGTIGAVGNDNLGVVGVNHQVSMVGCKFLDAFGSGTTSDAIECIDYMVDLKIQGHNIKVLNNSWGGGQFSQALSDAITATEQVDILFVVAAGNSASDNDAFPSYPSSYPQENILAVAGTNHNDGRYASSNYGLTTVDMGAPGVGILSTIPGGGYATFTGTSMASPHVAGSAALALSVNPSLSALELKRILMETGDPLEELDGFTVTGKRLNLLQALIEADPTPRFRFTADETSFTAVAGESLTIPLSVSSVSDWEGSVELSLDSPLEVAELSQDSASPGESFDLLITLDEDAIADDYEFTISGVSGELTSSIVVKLKVYPFNTQEYSYINDTLVEIPDANDTGITSSILVDDSIRILGATIALDISHTYIGDLNITLTSPRGTSFVVHNNQGASTDDIKRSFDLPLFEGEFGLGPWTLTVKDLLRADIGTLNNWSLTFLGVEEEIPALPPISSFTYTSDFLDVFFTDSSYDPNQDIVNWAWDFGDGSTSDEASPSYRYSATGDYLVTLTVTDANGESASSSQTVTVVAPATELLVDKFHYSALGFARVVLTWDLDTDEKIIVYRNGIRIDLVTNKGRFADRGRFLNTDQLIYQICTTSGACSSKAKIDLE